MSDTAKKSAESKVVAEPEKPATAARRYEDRTVDELQTLAADRGLVKSGTKDELIARLRGEPAPTVDDRRECVVDEGPNTFHVGRAVNGLVCSYHAMHYLADGTPRDR